MWYGSKFSNGTWPSSGRIGEVFQQSFSASMCPFYNIAHEYRVIMLDGEARLIYQKNRQDDNWKFNLSQGATVSRVDAEDLRQELTGLAQRAARAIGLRFCSVDIIRDAEGHNLLIIEINSGVATAHYLEQFQKIISKSKRFTATRYLRCFARRAIFEKHLTCDKVEDHSTGRGSDFSNHWMPICWDEPGQHGFVKEQEGNTIHNGKLNKEALAGLFVGGIEDPSGAGPEIEDSRNSKSNRTSDDWFGNFIWNRQEMQSDGKNCPVDGGVDDANDDELGELLKSRGMLVEMNNLHPQATSLSTMSSFFCFAMIIIIAEI